MLDTHSLHSIESSLLATVFYDSKALALYDDEVFSHHINKKVYNILKGLNDIDTNALYDVVRASLKGDEKDHLDTIVSYGAIVNADKYVAMIKKHNTKAKIQEKVHLLQSKINDDSFDSKSLIQEISRLQNQNYENKTKTLKDMCEDYKEYIAHIDDKGISYGDNLRQLDKATNGLKGGEFVIIAARPGVGKTTLALNIASNIINNNKHVSFISLEMSSNELIAKLMSSRADIYLNTLLSGDINKDHFASIKSKMLTSLDILSKTKLNIITENPNIQKLEILLKEKAQKKELDVVVIDYIGLMQNDNKNIKERHLQIADISRRLKLLALELNISIVCLAQLNREIDKQTDKTPNLSHLRDSGAIEQDADTIIFLSPYSQAKNDKFNFAKVTQTKLTIAKNRHGEQASFVLDFNKAKSRFELHVEEQEFQA